MAVIFADDFRSYPDGAADLPFGYDANVSAASAVLVASGGRTVIDLLGGTIARSISPSRNDVSLYLIADMSSGSTSSTNLVRLGINPPVVSGATSVNGGYLYLVFNEASVTVFRRAYTAVGAFTGSHTSIAAGTPPAIASGGFWRIEVRVNESSETCRIWVLINGVTVIDQEYARAMGANPCASGIGHIGISALNRSSSFSARLGDVLIYSHDAATPFPLGQLSLDGLETAVVDEVVTGTQIFALGDLASLPGEVIATSAVVRLESSGVTSRNVKASLIDASDAEIASKTRLIVSGLTNPDMRPDGGVLTLSQINAMKLKIEVL